MPAVLVDASPLIALTRIGKLELLKELFESIIITPEVAEEYELKPSDRLLQWMIVTPVLNRGVQARLERTLDRGEASLIALASEIEQPFLILDDRAARELAKGLGFIVSGTIGILIQAHVEQRIPDLATALSELRSAGFHFSKKLEKEALTITNKPLK